MLIRMIHANRHKDDKLLSPILPAWILDGSVAETPENAGFASGSALALLHGVLHDHTLGVPSELLRNHLAVYAAVQSLKFHRSNNSKVDVLDAYHLTRPGDERGPGGDMLAFWKKACAIRIGSRDWQDSVMSLVPDEMREDVYGWLDFSWDGPDIKNPVAAATDLLRSVHDHYPRNEVIGFMLADLRLAHDLRWPNSFPVFAQHLKPMHLKSKPDELLIHAHRAVFTVAQYATRKSYDLSRRSASLRAVAPKLRAKGSDAAVELFLKEEAITPSTMLSPKIKGTNIYMTARAARRLCDRLVDLEVVKELTGRSTFRLYGLPI